MRGAISKKFLSNGFWLINSNQILVESKKWNMFYYITYTINIWLLFEFNVLNLFENVVCVFFSRMIKFGGRYVAYSSQEWKDYKVKMNKCNQFDRDFNWFFLNLIFFPLKLWVLRARFLFPTWWHQNFDKSFQKVNKISLFYILH